MSLLLFFQQDATLTPVMVAIISGCGAVVVAVISVGGTWLAMRGTNRGAFVKSLTESLDILTRRVNANTQEMEAAQGTISRVEGERKQEARLAALSAEKIEKQDKLIDSLTTNAREMYDHFQHVDFIATHPIDDTDASPIWRLKTIRDISKRMMES